jgi:hypothetical protein
VSNRCANTTPVDGPKAQLGQAGGAARLPGGRLRPPAPRPGGLLLWGPPAPPDAVLAHEPPHRHAVGAELGGHVSYRPRPREEPVGQARLDAIEAELGGRGVRRCWVAWRRWRASRSARGGSVTLAWVRACLMV